MPQHVQMRIPIDQCKPMQCECGGTEFTPVISFARIPKVLNPTPEQAFLTAQRFQCRKCEKVWNNPNELIESVPLYVLN